MYTTKGKVKEIKNMKHYEIKKGKLGWYTATVTTKGGRKESYNYFFSKEEAKTWCYAKINYYFGREVANKEVR